MYIALAPSAVRVTPDMYSYCNFSVAKNASKKVMLRVVSDYVLLNLSYKRVAFIPCICYIWKCYVAIKAYLYVLLHCRLYFFHVSCNWKGTVAVKEKLSVLP
jgi:hypothetical protein